MSLNHVSLTVADPERSAAFYGTHFGLSERTQIADHLLVLSDERGSALALATGEPVGASLPPHNHFGFQVDKGDQVRAARERFAAAGLDETEWQDDDVVVRVQVLDPDGYRVELFAWTLFSAHQPIDTGP